MNRRIVVALVVVAFTLVMGFAAVHGGFNGCTSRALEAGAASWSSRWSWVPPGVECTYDHGDGSERTDLLPWS